MLPRAASTSPWMPVSSATSRAAVCSGSRPARRVRWAATTASGHGGPSVRSARPTARRAGRRAVDDQTAGRGLVRSRGPGRRQLRRSWQCRRWVQRGRVARGGWVSWPDGDCGGPADRLPRRRPRRRRGFPTRPPTPKRVVGIQPGARYPRVALGSPDVPDVTDAELLTHAAVELNRHGHVLREIGGRFALAGKHPLPRRRQRPGRDAGPAGHRSGLHHRRPARGDSAHRPAVGRCALWDTGIEYGTVGVGKGGDRLEITTFRADSYDQVSRNPRSGSATASTTIWCAATSPPARWR